MTTLVILAAGLGSRFGSDKQLENIHNGNALFDYAIYDALEAGFDNIVLIIRHAIDDLARQHLENRFAGVPITYVYQDDFNPKGIERKKPWGTGHAMLCVKDFVKGAFLIVNADDYYGKEGYRLMYEALNSEKEKTFFSGGYLLKNTLSDEATKLRKLDEHTAIDEETNTQYPLSTYVSMNFWGFTHEVFEIAERYFADFVEKNKENPKAEFYIPMVVQHAIKDYGYKLEVLPNHDSWFGMTYHEDLALVQNEIQKLVDKGAYPDRF